MPYGYLTNYGYKGYVNGEWRLFATEQEYEECIKEMEEDECTNQKID